VSHYPDVPAEPARPRRFSVAALLGTAAPRVAAVVALTTAPLVATLPVAGPGSQTRIQASLADSDPCQLLPGPGPLKHPECAGD
jgi:hypothetical protein